MRYWQGFSRFVGQNDMADAKLLETCAPFVASWPWPRNSTSPASPNDCPSSSHPRLRQYVNQLAVIASTVPNALIFRYRGRREIMEASSSSAPSPRNARLSPRRLPAQSSVMASRWITAVQLLSSLATRLAKLAGSIITTSPCWPSAVFALLSSRSPCATE